MSRPLACRSFESGWSGCDGDDATLSIRETPRRRRARRGLSRLYAPAREDFMVILDASLAGMKAEPPTALTGARAGAPMRATGARAAPDTARLAMDMVREAAIVPGAVSGRDE